MNDITYVINNSVNQKKNCVSIFCEGAASSMLTRGAGHCREATKKIQYARYKYSCWSDEQCDLSDEAGGGRAYITHSIHGQQIAACIKLVAWRYHQWEQCIRGLQKDGLIFIIYQWETLPPSGCWWGRLRLLKSSADVSYWFARRGDSDNARSVLYCCLSGQQTLRLRVGCCMESLEPQHLIVIGNWILSTHRLTKRFM